MSSLIWADIGLCEKSIFQVEGFILLVLLTSSSPLLDKVLRDRKQLGLTVKGIFIWTNQGLPYIQRLYTSLYTFPDCLLIPNLFTHIRLLGQPFLRSQGEEVYLKQTAESTCVHGAQSRPISALTAPFSHASSTASRLHFPLLAKGPIPWGDEIREIRPPTKKNSSLGLGAIWATANGHGRRSGGQ